jgi:GT2 family glycosyltransferase
MPDTLECLASLGASPSPLGVILVDNASADLDACAAERVCAGVRIVRAGANGGYAAGCNIGARAAAALTPDYLWLLNNDVVVAPDAAARLVAALDADPSAAVAGPVVRYHDAPELVWSAGGWVHPWLGYTRHVAYRAAAPLPGVRMVDFVNGAALLVRQTAFEQLGGFDEAYFHYFEDADLCARGAARGWRSIVAPDAVVRHKVSASAGTRGSDRLNRAQAYYFARNRVRFVRRNWRGARRAVALAAQPALVAYECAKALRAGNAGEARGRIEGLADGVRGRVGARRV